MTTRTSHKLGLIFVAFTALASVACGSAVTPKSSTASSVKHGDTPAYVERGRMDVSFQLNESSDYTSEEAQSEAHQPAQSIVISDVTDAQNHSLTALR
jgi:hypothetical protein